MTITILAVGKIKEQYWKDAIAEYVKRLSKYVKLNIIEVEDEKTPEKTSTVEEDNILKKEAARLMKYIKEGDYCIAMAIEGKKYDSVSFSEHINKLMVSSCSDITFIIGGSLGIHQSLKQLSRERISFSDMTFPHQLMRVILLEQIYRGFRIMQNEPYHK